MTDTDEQRRIGGEATRARAALPEASFGRLAWFGPARAWLAGFSLPGRLLMRSRQRSPR
jgi:hypothetical protein